MRKTVIGVAALTGVAAALSGAGVSTSAGATGDDGTSARIGVYGSGLNGPFGVDKVGRKRFVVAEAVDNQVTLVGPRGAKRVLVPNAYGAAGVAKRGKYVFSVLGGPDGTTRPAGSFKPSAVLRTNLRTGRTVPIANLLTYELNKNPDRQVQVYGDPADRDALSNPFGMTSYPGGLLVADGGANDVLKVNPRTGRVSTFFVPPNPRNAGCANANPGTTGCDSVPTGVTYAKGSVWVSTLGSDVPGAARIYKLNPRNGNVRQVWRNLTGLTGIAVAPDGAKFVSQVLEGSPPPGPPPAGFNPATVGQILKVHRGTIEQAQVTMPTGLVMRRGKLFSTAWSTAFFFGIPNAGQIVRVPRNEFN